MANYSSANNSQLIDLTNEMNSPDLIKPSSELIQFSQYLNSNSMLKLELKEGNKHSCSSLDPLLQLKLLRRSRQMLEQSRTNSNPISKPASQKLFHFGPEHHQLLKQDPQLNQLIDIPACLEQTFDNDLSLKDDGSVSRPHVLRLLPPYLQQLQNQDKQTWNPFVSSSIAKLAI